MTSLLVGDCFLFVGDGFLFSRSVVRIRRDSTTLIDTDLPKFPGAVAGGLRTGLFTSESLVYERRI